MRKTLQDYQKRVKAFADSPAGEEKAQYYFSALEDRLKACDQADEMIDLLGNQYPRPIDILVKEKKELHERS